MFQISHDADHISVSWLTMENEKGNREVRWDEVVSVVAFKQDLFAVDRICLDIELIDGSSIEVDEGMNGWDSLVQHLPDYLPGCQTFGEWFRVVGFPAFQLNETLLFERAGRPAPWI